MERKDLLEANGKIFGPQGHALSEVASRDVKVLVVGNPANTNCLIAMKNAPKLKPTQFTAMMRLDHNRAQTQIAQKIGQPVASIKKLTVWGNHSATQYPDFTNARINGRPVTDVISHVEWLKGDFIATVQQRGAAIIKARGASSAASAANAAIDTVKSLITPTPAGDWHSVAVCSDGSYGIEKGLIASMPIRTIENGKWEVVQGLPIDPFSQGKIDATIAELKEERDAVKNLIPG
jgi:malate dehydrogenase